MIDAIIAGLIDAIIAGLIFLVGAMGLVVLLALAVAPWVEKCHYEEDED